MREYRSGRIFRLSTFNPTHRQLTLRSDPGAPEDGALRIEFYFGNVSYLALQPLLRGIAIRRAMSEEQRLLGDRFGIPDDQREYIFPLTDSFPASFVVSGQPSWRQAERRVDDPSLFDFDQPWPPTDGEWGTIE
jgi:hypothetical protein